MGRPVSVHAARAQLVWLVKRALAGEEIVIGEGSTGAVRLVPVDRVPARVPGRWKGILGDCDAVVDPLPEHELRNWE